MVNAAFWNNKKVLITGHTGFKGSWLATWLLNMGAEVVGYALEPVEGSLYNELNNQNKIKQVFDDIRNAKSVNSFILEQEPDIIFHLASQPLVIEGYHQPVYTWETNVMGTIHVLEAVKQLKKKVAVVVVTTDKVYENNKGNYAYEETDKLGGYDPYSSSKAATEIAVASWRNSFCINNTGIRLATARAGNVIGGGDWAVNRIVPDCVRSLKSQSTLVVRNPQSVRPWQHVLESLSGYLVLAQQLYHSNNKIFQEPFNFGPSRDATKTVGELIETILKYWPGAWEVDHKNDHFHEAELLQLNINKAANILQWAPTWNFDQTVEKTISWYFQQSKGETALSLTLSQIHSFIQK